ncbi:MAG: B12-binding domain-containing radical SAM protein [Chloroflexi bacterium]|nr:B12-binding domain-containing radical SAM protein [Chloroflexota bacterium]
MNVLLILPYLAHNSTLWLPLGPPFIAARLRRDGHTVAIFDRYAVQFRVGRGRQRVDQAMLEQVQAFQPDLVGLSTLSPLIHDAVNCAALLRSVYDGPIVAGGYHATALPELTLHKIPALDGVVAGEGEIALTRLANGEAPEQVPGVWWRDGDEIRPPAALPEQIPDLDQLPLPALDLLDMDWYTQRTDGVIRRHNLAAATLVTARGCMYRCRFCAESLTYGRGVRCHSPAYVLEWMQRVVADYAVDGIHFHDNDFLFDEQRARAICHGIQDAGLDRQVKWSIQARADRLNRDLARLLKAAGCVLVEIGVETGTQPELDRVGKGTTPEMNREAVALCRQAGLDVHAYMLTALEGETIADLEQRLAWLKRARPTSFQWSPLLIFPGTVLYAEKGGDFFATHEWTEEAVTRYYSTDTLSAIPAEERREWMARRLSPYARWHWWRNALGHLPLRKLVRLAWFKLRRKARSKIG